MGIEHLAAVWEHSPQSGSSLLVLLAVASYSDHKGEWIIDQATLQKRARLSRRRVQQVLAELVAGGELAVVSQHGRGKLSTYRLLVEEKAKQSAPFPDPKGEAECTFPARKGAAECTFPEPKGEAECAFSGPKREADCAFSSPLAPPSPPFPPDPLYPHIPLTPPEEKNAETFGLRPLSGPQSAVFRVKLLLEEAGVPLPSPAQIGLWSKTLGGIEPLLELLRRLVQSGLATKREPIAYVHRVVMERAARPELPMRPAKPVNPLRYAGVDEVRRRQAARIAGIPWPPEGDGK